MINSNSIGRELRELSSEHLRNLYSFFKYAEDDGYLYIGREEHKVLFLTKENVIYNVIKGDWETTTGDRIFTCEIIPRLIEKAMFGYVPLKFTGVEQISLEWLMKIIERIDKEREHEILGGNEKLYRAVELMDEFTLTMHNIINKYDEVVKKEIL